MSFSRTPILRSLSSAYHKLAGTAMFRVHLYVRSRRHFERVLELKGDDFTAFVYLGRIAYNLGDRAGWRRESEHAKRTSPERYAKMKHSFELFEPRAAGNISEEAGERATWREIEVSSVGLRLDLESLEDPSGESQILRAAGLGTYSDKGCHLYGDDFSSEQERRRFRKLEAIDLRDLQQLDLDELIRQLTL